MREAPALDFEIPVSETKIGLNDHAHISKRVNEGSEDGGVAAQGLQLEDMPAAPIFPQAHRQDFRYLVRLVLIPEQALGYKFDVVLRGRDETPMEKPV